jgi:hypothetical protein
MTERYFERKRGRRMAAGRAGRNVDALENLDAINLALTGLSLSVPTQGSSKRWFRAVRPSFGTGGGAATQPDPLIASARRPMSGVNSNFGSSR